MGLNFRKTIVGLTVLVVLLGVFVAYSRWGGDAPLQTQAVQRPEPNQLTPIPDSRPATIGEARIERLSNSHFIHVDPDGNIDRDFGFLDLTGKQGNQWEATHPFMTLYEPKFKCSVTADKGQVQTESSFDRLIPNDAVFSGNVVIHVISRDPNEGGEAFIYLDDVVFTASKSLFSTTGPVRFISRMARLEGRGMELLYNAQRQQLELFRIQQLKSFLLRSQMLSTLNKSPGQSNKGSAVVSAGGRSEKRPASKPTAADAPKSPYECVLWKDVRMVTPEDFIVAKEWLAIRNILWSGPKEDEPNDADTATKKSSADKPKTEPNESQSPIVPRKDTADSTPSSALTLDSLPESLFDVGVTCKGRLVIRPMGTALSDSPTPNDVPGEEPATGPEDGNDPSRQNIVARRIEIDASTGNGVLVGPVRIRFQVDANDLFGPQYSGRKVPVDVTAQKDVRYLSDANQIVLDGNCVAVAQITEPNAVMECRLATPRLTLGLIEDPNASRKSAAKGGTKGTSVGLKLATASNGFTLQITRKTALQTTGEFYLEGTQLDYDAQRNDLVATGPGQVSLHNSQAADDGKDAGSVSLRKPCWAFLKKFDRLTYSGLSNRIVAESASKQLQVDYFELDKDHSDQYSRYVQADVGHIEIGLTKTTDNRMELDSLTASEGVAFREGNRQFDGSTLVYEGKKGLMTIRGDENTPCYLNGALVPGIEVNMKTGQVKTTLISPSTISTR